jgi:protoporphyrin/coproporphyrin ferrochelatase
MSRTAVVLFNLGGPDRLEAVEPFLFNLFNDRAIIDLPQPLRWPLARFIARRRAPVARDIYARIGGFSPIVANTEAQAAALQQALGRDHRVFIAMRYWPPLAEDAAAAVKAWAPDEVVLLPLYPQASTTTTRSSLAAWRAAAAAIGLAVPTRALCCYPEDSGFIAALAEEVRAVLREWPRGAAKRLLLSAHGLPKKIVAAGDPYQWQVERTAAALRKALADPALDTVICYQSRVGPLAWLEPATDAEIRRAGGEKIGLIVVPIAFVSEHSETLVELDLDYGHLAEKVGVPRYRRVPTVGAAANFIAGLAALVRGAGAGPCPAGGKRLCPRELQQCLCAA